MIAHAEFAHFLGIAPGEIFAAGIFLKLAQSGVKFGRCQRTTTN